MSLKYCISLHRYAREHIEKLKAENRLGTRSRFANWIPVTATEMEGFFAIIVNMGIIQIPNIEAYWSTSWTSEISFFSKVLRRDRFQQIFWLLHVSHDDIVVPVARINKVKALLDLLIPNFQASYNPSRDVSVDETMVGFRGRFGAKQYLPNKPTKYGVKAFTLADSSHGYVLNILLYTGKDTLANASSQYKDQSQPAQVVLHLAEPYLDQGRHVFTDRYYTSIPLTKALSDRSTAFTGTVMKNRADLPDEIRSKSFKLKDDEIVAYRTDRLLAMGWRAAQKKPVIMLSSEEPAKVVTVHNRRGQDVRKPQVVHHYNQSMNGVDIADQCCVYYSFIRKSKKWWRKVFFWLLEVTVVNSYTLHKIVSPQKLTHLEYRQRTLEALAMRHICSAPPRPGPGRPRKRPRQSSSGDPERLNGRPHFLAKRQSRECVVCSDPASGERHRTLYYCKTCSSQPSLCPDTCFELYHTEEHYRS